jgi:hypothetical protein
VTALRSFGVCAEGIPSHTSSVRRGFSIRDGLRLHVSVSASDSSVPSSCVCVCTHICAEGIVSHTKSVLILHCNVAFQYATETPGAT